jgi:hypothetical protein
MKTYNNAFTLAFEVSGCTTPDGSDVTQEQFVKALLERIKNLAENQEVLEAVGLAFDSHEETDVEPDLPRSEVYYFTPNKQLEVEVLTNEYGKHFADLRTYDGEVLVCLPLEDPNLWEEEVNNYLFEMGV